MAALTFAVFFCTWGEKKASKAETSAAETNRMKKHARDTVLSTRAC